MIQRSLLHAARRCAAFAAIQPAGRYIVSDATVKSKLFSEVQSHGDQHVKKGNDESLLLGAAPTGKTAHVSFLGVTRCAVTVVGCGAVGLASAFSIMNQGLASEIALLDTPTVESKVKAEVADIVHGSAFTRPCLVHGGSDYALCAGSNIVVVTAGARQTPGESRLALVGRNLKIYRSIIPNIVMHSPDCVILIVSNPVDIMTFVAQKLAGFPAGRVFGSGTALDSSRFRTLLAQRLGVDTHSVHGLILGEHGDSSVPLWSAVNVGGSRLRDVNPRLGLPDDAEFGSVHADVVHAAGAVIAAKGYTNWAVGLTVAGLCEAILRNDRTVLPLSVPAKGLYGITDDVYLSLPAVLGSRGVSDILRVQLEADEEGKLRASAAAIAEVQAELVF